MSEKPKTAEQADPEVEIVALEELKDKNNKTVPIGETMSVPKPTADILVDKKKAKFAK